MSAPRIFDSEYRFCTILWEHEPIGSTELARLCSQQLGWSKATTYTVIRRLSERGVIQNENSVVTSLISRDEAQTAEIEELVEKKFSGSLPAFIAAFLKHNKLTAEEIDEIRRLMDDCHP
ncbi:MAG: BlaI/MecI/CopY family transcriptional regulator, partial [Eubacteriales bacterium]